MSNTAAQIEKQWYRLAHALVSIIVLVSLLSVVFMLVLIEDKSLILLVVASAVILSTSVIMLGRFYFRHVRKILAPLIDLERWADKSMIFGKLQPLDLDSQPDDSLHKVIYQLTSQLEQAKLSDSHFDTAIRSNALLDKQTGIGNREFFNNRLEALLKEEDVQGAVYFIQFNDLDVVQALYGDQQAAALFDTLVATIQHRLNHLGKYYLARRAEFELAIIMPGIFLTDAEKLADRLLKSLSSIALPVGINKDVFVHIGISYFSDAENSYQIKSEADMALRSAQLQGPSQWFMYDLGEVEHVSAKGSLQWRTFLERAISGNTFVIFLQPVIAKDGVSILHHEVLSKVRDSDGSLISARVFLPMARKCGLTSRIDFLILAQMSRLLAYDKNRKDHCSVNFSIETLLAKSFIEQFTQTLLAQPSLKDRLIVEISEYQLVSHLQELKPVLEALVHLGVKLLVDKVGQYIESTEYLASCPITFIKLHPCIILHIDIKPENQIFVQSLSTICQKYHVDMYALGVENVQEWRTLLRLGVNGGQGHYFTEPVAQVAKAIHLI